MKKIILILVLSLSSLLLALYVACDLGRSAAAIPPASVNGDVNCDGELNVGDPIFLLWHLFMGGPEPCAFADSPELVERVAALETTIVELSQRVTSLEEGGGDLPESVFLQLSRLLEPGDPPAGLPPGTLRLLGCPTPRAPVVSCLVKDQSLGTVIGFAGTERISMPYEYRVALRSAAGGADRDALIGQDVLLRFEGADVVTERTGVIREFALAAIDNRSAVYVLTFVPRLWLLSQSRGQRTFLDTPIDGIIRAVLADAGLSANISSVPVPPRPYTGQHIETDLDFISRLMETSGLFYFFQNDKTGEQVSITRSATGLPVIPGGLIAYRGHLANATGVEYVRTFEARSRAFTGAATVVDWNLHQKEALRAMATDPDGLGESVEYGAGYPSQEEVTELSKVRLKESQARRRTMAGTGNAPGFRPGYKFKLQHTMLGGIEGPFGGEYLLTAVRHVCVLLEDSAQPCYYYGNEFAARPATQAYQPPSRMPRPRIHGTEPAIVTNIKDPDGLGRVKVHLVSAPEGVETGWCRVAHPSAGKERGVVFQLDIEDEVLIAFEHGDPDRPVVIGGLHNGKEPPPYPTPDGKTLVSTIRMKGGGCDQDQVEIRFDDTQDREQLDICSPRLRISVPVTSVSGELLSEQNAGAGVPAGLGARYRDNSIVAWARVGGDGSLDQAEFGVQQVTHTTAGIYQIDLDIAATSVGELIPIVTPIAIGRSDNPLLARLVSVSQFDSDTFRVYVTDGNYDLASGPFVFLVTAR